VAASNIDDMESPAPETALRPSRPAPADDRELVARFQAGYVAAFDRLVAVHQARVARLAQRLLGRDDAIDDVVQEVFLAVLKNLAHFRDEAQFSTWLTTITLNKCRSHQRWQWRRWRLFAQRADVDVACTTLPEALPPAGEHVTRAVVQLPAKYREPIVLRYFEDYSIAEIAGVLGISAGAVEVRLTRARRRLKRLLEPMMRNL
jgi:RNA polymerase sigma factor CnrH